jgi:hypothetical protein
VKLSDWLITEFIQPYPYFVPCIARGRIEAATLPKRNLD